MATKLEQAIQKKSLKIKIVGYVRVSTNKQIKMGTSIDDQSTNIRLYAQKLNIAHDIHIDAGYSGYIGMEKRPGLNKAIASLNKDDILYVVTQDRLARDVDLRGHLKYIIKHEKKAYLVCGDDIESTDAGQRLVDSFIKDLTDQQYSSLVSCKVKNTIRAKKEHLSAWTGVVPYGFSKLDDKSIIINEYEQQVMNRVAALQLEHRNNTEIARVLTNEEYIKPMKTSTSTPKWEHYNIRNITRSAKQFEWLLKKLRDKQANITH